MTKIKDLYVKIGDEFKKVSTLEDTKKHKIAKVVSLLVGAFFDIFGIIAVAVWKYLFCSKEENSKYCIRLAIFGMIIKCIICSKILFATNLPFFAKHKQATKQTYQHDVEMPFFDDDFFNFNLDIDKEIDRMNQRFNRMHMAFNNAMKEQEKEMQKNKTLQSKDTNVRKEVKMNNGYETTIVEEKSPNLYSKKVNIRYVGDNKKKENNIKKSDAKRGEQKIKNDSKSKQMPEKKVKK